MHRRRPLFAAFLAVLAVGLSGFKAPLHADSPVRALTPVNFADLADQLRHTVVNIRVVQQLQGPGGQLFFNGQPIDPNDPGLPDVFRRFFGQFGVPQPPERQGQGSGVILSKDGYIATNHHVVQGAKEITVVLWDEAEYEGKVVGTDPKTDLALVKIEPKTPLEPAVMGSSEKLRVGEWVMAIGNPFGLAETVTVGIVSAKGRVIGAGPYDDFIQTDASINPGNSGGPLFNLEGQVVGINTAIVAQGQGIGFAIPSDLARNVLDQLKTAGRVERGWLGVGIQRITKELAESMGLSSTNGALVSQIFEDSPAKEAGFQVGDVIVEYNGTEIRDVPDLPKLVAHTPVGAEANVVVLREGKRKRLRATIIKLDDEQSVAAGPAQQETPEAAAEKYGLTLRKLTPQLAAKTGILVKRGILIENVERGGAGERAGLIAGDVIIEINHRPVDSPNDFINAAKKAREERLLLRVVRGENYMFAVVKP